MFDGPNFQPKSLDDVLYRESFPHVLEDEAN